MAISTINEYKLIEVVRGRPEVWDKKSPLFRNKHRKREGWQRVAVEMGYPLDDCMNTWRRLRDYYSRMTRKINDPEAEIREWDKTEKMRFLDQVIIRRHHRQSTGNPLDLDDQIMEDSQISVTENDEITFPVVAFPLKTDTLDIPSPSTSHGFFSSCSENTEENSTYVVPKRQRTDGEVTKLLVNSTTHKLADNEEGTTGIDPAEDPVITAFLKYNGEQIKQLFVGKSAIQQRKIRSRITTFMDELFEEFEFELQ